MCDRIAFLPIDTPLSVNHKIDRGFDTPVYEETKSIESTRNDSLGVRVQTTISKSSTPHHRVPSSFSCHRWDKVTFMCLQFSPSDSIDGGCPLDWIDQVFRRDRGKESGRKYPRAQMYCPGVDCCRWCYGLLDSVLI